MEASIIFHFAGRGNAGQRLALIDFAQLLDPKWHPPREVSETKSKPRSILSRFAQSVYNFGLGGVAGAMGATIVYPIDLGESSKFCGILSSVIISMNF